MCLYEIPLLWRIVARVRRANGRVDLAADPGVAEDDIRATLGSEETTNFVELKRQLDPDGLIGGNLYRRLFPVAR